MDSFLSLPSLFIPKNFKGLVTRILTVIKKKKIEHVNLLNFTVIKTWNVFMCRITPQKNVGGLNLTYYKNKFLFQVAGPASKHFENL